MESVEFLRLVQAGLYVVLAIVAARIWWRDRTRSAAHLVLAFVCLGGAILLGQLPAAASTGGQIWLSSLSLIMVLAIPWLFASFAWSFTYRHTPTWLWVAALVQVLFAAALIGPRLAGAAIVQQGPGPALRWAAALVWLGLCLAAAARLWRAGPQHRVVRARTRSMAVGALALGVAVLTSATTPDTPGIEIALVLMTLVAGLLFGVAFAAPLPLRWWWRQLPSAQLASMQTSLIAASTPREVAEAIVPTVAALYGADVVLLDPDGQTVASTSDNQDRLRELERRLASDSLSPRSVVSEAEGYRLVIDASPYAPVFGGMESDLLRTVLLQFRLALQRAELAAANHTAHRALQQAAEEQQAMLIGLAHDLRSPTVTIAAYSTLLQEAETLEEAKAMAADIAISADYLDRLVDGLSELSRIGRRDEPTEPVAIDEIVRRTAERLAPTYPQLQVQIDGPLPVILSDRLRAEQLLDNLINNAAKHAGRPNVTVTISATITESTATIIVADDGPGIPDQEHDTIFRPFRQGSQTQAPGSGVGLSLARRIVTSLGGSIDLTPSATGARFQLQFPNSALSTTTSQQTAVTPTASPSGARSRRSTG